MAQTDGRPSGYKEQYIQEVKEYLKTRQDEEYKTEKGFALKVNLPTIEGFAIYLGVCKKTIYNWMKEHDDFLHAIEEIEHEQKKRLLDRGLEGTYNSTIAKLVLSVNHGMKETSGLEVSGKGGKDLFPDKETKDMTEKAVNDFLDARAKANP